MEFHKFENPEEMLEFFRSMGLDPNVIGGVSLESFPMPDPINKIDGEVTGKGRPTRWQYRLYPDTVPLNEIFVEEPKRLHPRAARKMTRVLSRYEVKDIHHCRKGPVEWDSKSIHIVVPQSEPCEEIANLIGTVLNRQQLGWFGSAWVKLRVKLAQLFAPDGMAVRLEEEEED